MDRAIVSQRRSHDNSSPQAAPFVSESGTQAIIPDAQGYVTVRLERKFRLKTEDGLQPTSAFQSAQADCDYEPELQFRVCGAANYRLCRSPIDGIAVAWFRQLKSVLTLDHRES